MEADCRRALAQMKERRYAAELEKEGYQNIKQYGLCFFRKECMAMAAE